MSAHEGPVARSAATLLASQILKFFVSTLTVIVLSRLISPAEIGIATIGWAVVSAGEILRDFGLTAAVVRSVSVSREQKNNLFWLNTAIGVVLAGLVIVLSPVLSWVFALPPLGPVLIALSPVFILNGLSAQFRADLNRRRMFKQLALVDVIAPSVGLVAAIPVAILGHGYWAIVVQYNIMAVATLLTLAVLGGWLPGLPARRHSVRSFLGFGGRVAVSQGMAYLGNNVDTLALGLFSSTAAVGFYGRGFQLSVSPLTQLRAPATAVAVPTLSRQRERPEQFMKTLLRGQLLVGYMGLPLSAFMAAAHGPLIQIALGEAWSESAPVFAVLAIAGGLQALSSVANWVFLTVGDGRGLQRYSALALIVKVALVVSLAWAGPLAVAYAYLGSVILLWPVAVSWALKEASLSPRPVLFQGLRILMVSLVAGGAGYAAGNWIQDPWLSVLLSATTLALTFVAASLIPICRGDYATLLGEVKRLKR